LLPTSFWSALPEPAAGRYQSFASSPRGARNTAAESASLPALLTQAQALTTLHSTPLVVVTAAGHAADPDWAAAHDRMAALSTNKRPPPRRPQPRGPARRGAGRQPGGPRHRRRRRGRAHGDPAPAALTPPARIATWPGRKGPDRARRDDGSAVLSRCTRT